MEQVQNGRIGAIPRKVKQMSAKSIQTISLSYSSAKSTLKVPLTFNKVEKTKNENFNFVHLVSSVDQHNLATIRCMQILYIPRTALLLGIFLFWFGMAHELQPRNRLETCLTFSFIKFCCFCLWISVVACIVKPHPDYWTRVTVSKPQSKQKFDYSFSIYLALKTANSPIRVFTC